MGLLICLMLFWSSMTFAETTTVTQTTVNPPAAEDPSNSVTTTTVTTSEPVIKESDTKIISAIYDSYAKDAAMIGTTVNVKAKDGIVELTGNVTMQSQAEQAVLLAKKVSGVKDVRSAITVTTNRKTGVPVKSPNY